ncbi:MAG: hypothetical protein AB1454_13600 [Candidatus Auribacterota bacterium]|jgi:hypothetical protein
MNSVILREPLECVSRIFRVHLPSDKVVIHYFSMPIVYNNDIVKLSKFLLNKNFAF